MGIGNVRWVVGLAALVMAGAADAATVALDVTARSEAGVAFSAPIFTFTNLSDPGFQISALRLSNGPPIDYVYVGPTGTPYEILNPAGGARTLTEGQEASFNPNDGCTAGVGYALTSFDPGDSFRYSIDPEGPGCANAVVDIRPWLVGDLLRIDVTFSDGTSLNGSDWTLELVDPAASAAIDANQLYRLSLRAQVGGAVPEPATWGMMLLGFGGMGYAMRRRPKASPLGRFA